MNESVGGYQWLSSFRFQSCSCIACSKVLEEWGIQDFEKSRECRGFEHRADPKSANWALGEQTLILTQNDPFQAFFVVSL